MEEKRSFLTRKKLKGVVIIDQLLLGETFINVIFREADKLAEEKGLDKDLIGKELATAQTVFDFQNVLKNHFGDEIRIRLNI
jgi:hypothetical protein